MSDVFSNPLGGINTTQMTQGVLQRQTEALQRQFKTAGEPLQLGQPLSGDALVKKHAELKKSAQQLEGVFLQQLLEAMDKTVDREDSMFGGGEGEQMFREMMYQNVAEGISTAPGGSGFGLAEAMYRQLSEKLPPLPVDETSAQGVQQASTQMAGRKAYGVPGDVVQHLPVTSHSTNTPTEGAN